MAVDDVIGSMRGERGGEFLEMREWSVRLVKRNLNARSH